MSAHRASADMAPDDRELVESLRSGRADALEKFVLAYQGRVFSIAYRMLGDQAEAEKVAHEAFLRAHRSIRDLQGDSALSTVIYSAVAQLCVNRPKSAQRRRSDGGQGPAQPSDGLSDTAPDAPESERAIQHALLELDDDRRIVVVLRDFHGCSYEEIAEALDLEFGMVRSRLHRGRMELMSRLERPAQ